MQKHYAKLIVGGNYALLGQPPFERNVEVPVTKEVHDYLSTVNEKQLVNQGNGVKVVVHPRFALRTEAPTKEEKVLDEIKDVPDKLAPKKPVK